MRNYFDKAKVKRVINRNGDQSVLLLFQMLKIMTKIST